MVHRYYMKCSVCGSVSVLRIQLPRETGTDDIFFNCKSCGILNVSNFTAKFMDETPYLKLETDNFELIERQDLEPDNFQTIAVDLPFRADANDANPLHFSTFLDQVGLLGLPKFQAVIQEVEMFCGISKIILEKSRLLQHFYDKSDTNRYIKTLDDAFYIKRISNVNSIYDRTFEFYKEVILLMEKDQLLEMSNKEIDSLVASAYAQDSNKLKYLISKDYLEDSLRINKKSIELIQKVMDMKRVLGIGYLVDHYKDDVDLYNIHVSVDRFQEIKSMYMDSFENFHKTVDYFISLTNLNKSKGPNLVNNNAYNRKNLRRLSSSIKNNYLKGEMQDYPMISKLLDLGDNRLRNSIGHYEITLDHTANKIRVNEITEIPYSQMFKEYYYSLFLNLATLNITRWIIRLNKDKPFKL